ncbi:MAG: UDP-N-acetylglucosamine 1-carboxyvinyltransferase [Candidatus Dasytiphilus stammeri]
MNQFYIHGPCQLNGEVKISGAKNAALPILFSTLLADEPIEIENIPKIKDVYFTIKLLNELGVKTLYKNNSVYIDPSTINTYCASSKLVKTMRASILLLGTLVARLGQAKLCKPGGCTIGDRPIDLHISALKRLGVTFILEDYDINAFGPLKGSHIFMEKKSVGATLTVMCAATLARGNTIIDNAALEPEIKDTAEFLNVLGAKIYGAGSNRIHITGVKRLRGGKYTIMPDRIETGTFLIAAAISRGKIVCRDTQPYILNSVYSKLHEAGAKITLGSDWIELNMYGKRPRGVNITTASYPGFPTDMQAQFSLLNMIAEGRSIITESIFNNRFMHVAELIRMGAQAQVQHNRLICNGVKILYGTKVIASDLRGSACLILAGCIAQGTTVINDLDYIDRGYENIEDKLRKLGAKIQRTSRLIMR